MVYLTGAGPGDPSLITTGALELLRTAEVVLYDRLADPGFLLETPHGCVLVDVGKSTGDHTKSQDEINVLLLDYGRRYDRVVRLKGGDPFLFGRGGEEAEVLADAGIPFSVVPGVSALLAATAYAGIPITHRGHASSVGVATGHGARGKDDDPVRWRELARGVDTVVVFMGVGALGTITGELVAGGMSPDLPAAVIERGATPRQRVITATLSTIALRVREEKVNPPALFVCGPSVPLANRIGWYHPGPLAGLTIGVTRPVAQSKSFADRLRALGAQPVMMPTIAVRHTLDRPEVHSALEQLAVYDTIAFSSANGVESFFTALERTGRDSRALAGKTLAAIGPATAESLKNHGLKADIEAATFIAEGLLEAICTVQPVVGRKVLIVRSDIGRDTLAEGLRDAGAQVDQASFYATERAILRPIVKEQLLDGSIDLVTFTSSSTVDGFFSQVSAPELVNKTRFASIGPQTSAALRHYGVNPHMEAGVYTTAGLAEAILAAHRELKEQE